MKSATIGRSLSEEAVFTPRVDETPVPCESYHGSDCIYLTDNVDYGYLGLDPQSSLTTFINSLVCHLKEQEREIKSLKIKVENLITYSNEFQ